MLKPYIYIYMDMSLALVHIQFAEINICVVFNNTYWGFLGGMKQIWRNENEKSK